MYASRAQAGGAECTRHFVAALLAALGFNVLFALIHTLGANSSLGDGVARIFTHSGFLAVGAMFIGAYVIGYQYDQRRRVPFALLLVAAGILTQVHCFWTAPALAGSAEGIVYSFIDVIVAVVAGYDTLLRGRSVAPSPSSCCVSAFSGWCACL